MNSPAIRHSKKHRQSLSVVSWLSEAVKNGQPSMYLFDGGYASFNANGVVDGWHYYIQDYMGNNRMVVNKNGTVEQVTHYYPYGGVIGDISTNESVQKYKFEGKELDRTFGLDNYDIHARQYFAMMPSWDRIDPLSEKYYGISPYAYCGGDPVNHGDYNGKMLYPEDNQSWSFMVSLALAILAIENSGCAGETVNALNCYIPVREIDADDPTGNTFYRSINTICWSPYLASEKYTYPEAIEDVGAATELEVYYSAPFEALNHEADHGQQYAQNNEQFIQDAKPGSDAQYDKIEEKRVITGSEQRLAQALGKLQPGQVTRNNHDGSGYIVDGPCSTTKVKERTTMINLPTFIITKNTKEK